MSEPGPNWGSEPYEQNLIDPTGGDCICDGCGEDCFECRCDEDGERADEEEYDEWFPYGCHDARRAPGGLALRERMRYRRTNGRLLRGEPMSSRTLLHKAFRRWTIALEFKPADLWVGLYYRTFREAGEHMFEGWICLLPMLPIHFSFETGRK